MKKTFVSFMSLIFFCSMVGCTKNESGVMDENHILESSWKESELQTELESETESESIVAAEPTEMAAQENMIFPETAEIINLGIPTESSYPDIMSTSRNPWDMIIETGKLYLGAGDYSRNTGPTSIWCYDIKSEEWLRSGMVNDEAILRFVKIGNELMAPGTDPKEGWMLGNYYVLKEDGWETVRKIPKAVHMYDIVEFDGGLFFGIGTSDDDVSPVQVSWDGGETYEDVQFLKDGEKLFFQGNYARCRVYDIFVIDDRMYCTCEAYDSSASFERFSSVFQYEDGAFHYIGNKGFTYKKDRQSRIYDKEYMDGACFFTTGYLYKTSDFLNVTKLELPDSVKAEDLLIEPDPKTGKDILYILSSKRVKANEYINTVWKYIDAETFEEVCSFEAGLSAMSFEKYEEDFFVGLGAYVDDWSGNKLTGTILRIDL